MLILINPEVTELKVLHVLVPSLAKHLMLIEVMSIERLLSDLEGALEASPIPFLVYLPVPLPQMDVLSLARFVLHIRHAISKIVWIDEESMEVDIPVGSFKKRTRYSGMTGGSTGAEVVETVCTVEDLPKSNSWGIW